MQVSLSELKTNIGKYVKMAKEQDIYITRNGKRTAKITSLQENRVQSAKALFGILPSDTDLDFAREERLK